MRKIQRKIQVGTARAYANLFWPEFVVVDDCVFLKWEWEINSHIYNPQYPTQSEADMNHTHIFDQVLHRAAIRKDPYLDTSHPDFAAAWQLGKTLCEMWAVKLLLDFPQQDFRVYFHAFEPIIRFHKVRAGVPNWVENKHWSKAVKSGAACIIETGELRKRLKGQTR